MKALQATRRSAARRQVATSLVPERVWPGRRRASGAEPSCSTASTMASAKRCRCEPEHTCHYEEVGRVCTRAHAHADVRADKHRHVRAHTHAMHAHAHAPTGTRTPRLQMRDTRQEPPALDLLLITSLCKAPVPLFRLAPSSVLNPSIRFLGQLEKSSCLA